MAYLQKIYIFLLIVIGLTSLDVYAQKKRKKLYKNIRMGKFGITQSLGFYEVDIGEEGNRLIFEPFVPSETPLVLYQRFISKNYVEVALVHLSTYHPYDPEFDYKTLNLKKHGILVLYQRDKTRGDKGKLFKLKQRVKGMDLIKWVAIMGNEHQTNYFLAMCRIEMELSFVSDVLEQIVESSYISNQPIE